MYLHFTQVILYDKIVEPTIWEYVLFKIERRALQEQYPLQLRGLKKTWDSYL